MHVCVSCYKKEEKKKYKYTKINVERLTIKISIPKMQPKTNTFSTIGWTKESKNEGSQFLTCFEMTKSVTYFSFYIFFKSTDMKSKSTRHQKKLTINVKRQNYKFLLLFCNPKMALSVTDLFICNRLKIITFSIERRES